MKVIWNVVRTKIKIIIVKFWGSFGVMLQFLIE